MQRKTIIFIADSLDNAHKFQQVLSKLDVDVAAGSSVQFKKLLAAHPSHDLVIYEARGDALGTVASVEAALAEEGATAMLVIVNEDQLAQFRLPVSCKADFVVHGASAAECATRIRQLLWPGNEGSSADYITVDNMTVNLATYQVKVGGEPVDLTYLEYALLAFLVTIRAAPTPETRCCAACGASTTTAAAAPWTSTCAAFAPSSARSSLSAWRRCAASAICGTPKTRKARNVKKDCRYRRKLAHASCLPCGADAHDRQGRHPHQRRLRLPHHALQVHRNGLAGRGGVRLRRRQAGAPHRGHGPVQGHSGRPWTRSCTCSFPSFRSCSSPWPSPW